MKSYHHWMADLNSSGKLMLKLNNNNDRHFHH